MRQVAFSVAWPEYAPTDYTAAPVLAKPEWADDGDNIAAIKFKQLDVDNHVLAGKASAPAPPPDFYTLHPTPCIPYTLHPIPYIPYTPYPISSTPHTLYPLHPTPYIPYTLHHIPYIPCTP